MQLRDLRPEPNQQPYMGNKAAEHAEINAQVCQFIACGGAINQIPPGVSGEIAGPATKKMTARKQAAGGVHFDRQNHAKMRSVHGQNILQRGKGERMYYIVGIGKTQYGAGERWTKEQAIAYRDAMRNTLGLPPAEY